MVFISIWLALNVDIDRLQRYAKWMASDPVEFFRVPGCLAWHCPSEMKACYSDANCSATVNCSQECSLNEPRSKQAMCAYLCEMTDGYENQAFTDVMNCMIEGNCISNYPKAQSEIF